MATPHTPALRLLSAHATGTSWVPSSTPAGPTIFTRPLGVLERKFDLATQLDGQSDTFVRLSLHLPTVAAESTFFARLVHAWARVRARHPLLGATVGDAVEMGEREGHLHLPQPREFWVEVPGDEEEAVRRAWETVLVKESEEVGETMEEVLDGRILNKPRVLLDQERCLARLVVVRDVLMGTARTHGFFLVISHVISDGMSVYQILKELFSFISDPTLHTPSSTPPFASLDAFLAGKPTPPPSFDSPSSAWEVLPPMTTIFDRLPLASEDVYPILPIPPSLIPPAKPPSSSPTTPSHSPRLARQRWFWAISRTLLVVSHRLHPRSLQLERMEPNPPVQAKTRWPAFSFSKMETYRLVHLSKLNGLSPSMLLYSILALAMSNIFSRTRAFATYQPIVLGFPFSLRPFLDPSLPLVANDLAIRITFAAIHLPNSPQAITRENIDKLRWTVLQGARLAKRQFAKRLDPHPKQRGLLLSSSYFMILDRLKSSLGVNDDAFNEPRGAVNASMVGDLDRILPTTFSLPSLPFLPPATLTLSDMLLGTRLHRGEGILIESYTWDGQMTFGLGWDEHCLKREQVEEILDEVRGIGEMLAREGRN